MEKTYNASNQQQRRKKRVREQQKVIDSLMGGPASAREIAKQLEDAPTERWRGMTPSMVGNRLGELKRQGRVVRLDKSSKRGNSTYRPADAQWAIVDGRQYARKLTEKQKQKLLNDPDKLNSEMEKTKSRITLHYEMIDNWSRPEYWEKQGTNIIRLQIEREGGLEKALESQKQGLRKAMERIAEYKQLANLSERQEALDISPKTVNPKVMENIARSASGRLRNYGSMNSKKFKAILEMSNTFKNDDAAYKAVKAEAKKRGITLYHGVALSMVEKWQLDRQADDDKPKKSADVDFDSKRSIAKSRQPNSTEQKPEIMKAARYKGKKDYTGWLLSEKYDGFRAIWDGEKFISKNGNVFYAPEEFTKGFPKVRLDGELWAGREEYQKAASIIRRKPESKDYNKDDWNDLKYVVFDAPGLYSEYTDLKKLTQNEFGAWDGGIREYMKANDFEEAMALMKEWKEGIAKLPDENWKTSGYYNLDGTPTIAFGGGSIGTKTIPSADNLILAPQVVVEDGSEASILAAMDDLVMGGAEGVMLRDPKSPYSPGRKSSIIKVKPSWTEEARVIGYEEGLNRNEGKVGALLVESLVTPGLEFKIGTGLSDADRLNPPKRGEVVEYKFNGKMKSGKPRHAAFLRVRKDMNRRTSESIRHINKQKFRGIGATRNKTYARMVAQRVRDVANRNARVIPRSGGYGIYVSNRRRS
jgi:DNA ligase-1